MSHLHISCYSRAFQVERRDAGPIGFWHILSFLFFSKKLRLFETQMLLGVMDGYEGRGWDAVLRVLSAWGRHEGPSEVSKAGYWSGLSTAATRGAEASDGPIRDQ